MALLGYSLPFALFVLWAVLYEGNAQRPIPLLRGVHLRGSRIGAHALAGIAAVVCTVVTCWIVGKGSGQATTVSWSGIQCAESNSGCQELRIGGDPSARALGWPNGTYAPDVAFRVRNGALHLQMQGGGGFVLHGDEPLNGVPFDPLQRSSFASYVLVPTGCGGTFGRLWGALSAWPALWRQCSPRLMFYESGRVVAAVEIAAAADNRSKPIRLADLVLRRSRTGFMEKIAGNRAPVPPPSPEFIEWASSVLLYRNGASREVRLLDERNFTGAVPLSENLTVVWPGRTRERIRFSETPRVRIEFGRPYTRSAPVQNAAAPVHDFIVTTAPEPGDYAFVLPVGQSEPDPRYPIRLMDEPPPAAEGLPPHVLDREVIALTAGDVTLDLRQDAFAAGAIRWRLAVLLCVFLLSVTIVARMSVDLPHSVRLSGMLLGTWMLLMLRIVLAVRYIIPPAPLDWLAVKGILFSTWPAALLPVILASFVVNHYETTQGASRGPRRVRLMLAAAGVVALIAVYTLPTSLWNPLPEKLAPILRQYRLALTAFSSLLLLWILRPRIVFGAHGVGRGIRFDPNVAMRRWQALYSTAPATVRGRGTLAEFPRTGRSVLRVFIGTLLAILFVAAFVRADLDVLVRDVGIHGLWLWFPAILWLGSLVYFNAGQPLLLPIAWTAAIAIFVTPFVAGDPGSIVSAASVFAALALILLHYPRSRAASFTIALVLLLGIAAGVAAYVNVEGLFSKVPWAGNAPKYVLVYKHGVASTSDILGQSANLANAYQHNWENQAMVARGGIGGAGYGEAPARRSWVRQDTLQYDSVYAFFIAGDHGLLGGMSLLSIYIGLVILGAMGRHAQSAFGAIPLLVFLAMTLEALVHAAMNVGLLPFAGRDLPLLAVISVTDVLKWSLLIAIAFIGDLADTSSPVGTVRRPAFRSIYLAVGVFTGACLGVQISRIAGDRFESFSWEPLLAEARQYIERGEISLDPAGEIVFRGRAARLSDESMLALERDRFNLSTVQQRHGGAAGTNLTAALYRVNRRADYNRVMAGALTSGSGLTSFRPLMFRYEEARRYADLAGLLRLAAPGGGAVLDVNPAYNTQLSFERDAAAQEFPRLYYRDRGRHWELRGRGFIIDIPARPRRPFEARRITLRRNNRGELRVVDDTNPGGADVTLLLDIDRSNQIAATGDRRTTRMPILELKYQNDAPAVSNVRQGMTWEVQHADGDTKILQPVNDPFRGSSALSEGDVVRPAAAGLSDVLEMHVVERESGTIVGPAWVMGRQVAVVRSDSNIPWLGVFGSASGSQAREVGAFLRGKSEEVTLDRALQQRAQSFVWSKGAALHQARLANVGTYRAGLLRTRAYAAHPDRARIAFISERVLPPRIGLAIVAVPDGRVLAMGSWPRPEFGQASSSPSFDMLDALGRSAPGYVKTRHLGDRNFDRVEVGSATKPIMAAAALTLQPQLDRRLCVKWDPGSDPQGAESAVFGIPVRGAAWKLGHSDYIGRPVDFDSYLQDSSNLYQIRLGFLALAQRNQTGEAEGVPGSQSREESMAGCTSQWASWGHYPRFPDGLEFSHLSPGALHALYDSEFAAQMRRLYAVGTRWQETRQIRESFWSAVADDDFRSPAQRNANLRERSTVPSLFASISPETTNLELDEVDTPRKYVSFLLGGSTNRWANTDLAAAFGTAVTGNAVYPHILSVAPTGRPSFAPIQAASTRLRPGLRSVWMRGTATALIPIAEQFQREGISVYVKTGTAEVDSRDEFAAPETSRILVALIRWSDEPAGRLDKGLVLSLYGERAGMGTATQWMRDFLADARNRAMLMQFLEPQPRVAP